MKKIEGKGRSVRELLWADHAERHKDEFIHPSDFATMRNQLGGLLLLPKSFNASYGDLAYLEKLPHYYGQKLLARSLHPQCYENNPGFLRFIQETGLPFKAMTTFKSAQTEERCPPYLKLVELIWNAEQLSTEALA